MYEEYCEGAERIEKRIEELQSQLKRTRDTHKRDSLQKRIYELRTECLDMRKACRDIKKYIER